MIRLCTTIARRARALTRETDALLSFEWVLLLTLLTIGVVTGIAAARDAIIDEMGDIAEAAQAFDQSYSLSDFDIPGIFENNPSEFIEGPEDAMVQDCGRTNLGSPDQGGLDDGPE